MLTRGISGITDPPATHRQLNECYDPDPKKPDHIYCKRGGFLPSIDFDPTEFNIPPNVIEATDTSQLLALATAKKALDDAGYGERGRAFDRSRTSVVLGVTGTQELVIPLGARMGHPLWKKALCESGVPEEQAEQVIRKIADGYVGWQENSFPGLLGNVVAGRIANRLDLGGTNCAVDAACASSMGAIHMALLELLSGRSDMVISGGVDTINDAFMHMCFSKTQILSPTGDVRPFSQDADGTVLGEGIGLIVLKRLQDAEKDGDRIYAVIKGLGSASDGRSQSIYAPRPEGQAKAIRTALRQAGTDPADVRLVEAHGTGTRVGDQVEFKALCDVFGEVSPNGNRCALGSVKSNIGHTKAAAGSAGLIKAALAVYHKLLPPTLKAETVDPKLGVEQSPFYINTRLRPWVATGHNKRTAGVSAFGFGGSNFHTVVEEYLPSKQEPSWDGSVEIAAFSGKDNQDVTARIEQWSRQAAETHDRHYIGKLARQSRSGFSASDPVRLVMVLALEADPKTVSSSCKQALLQLSGRQAVPGSNVFVGHGPRKGKLAYLFPGQGSQYVGMGRDLICCLPESFEAFEDAATSLKAQVALDEFIFPRMPADTDSYERQLRQTHIAQPAIGAVSVAMLRALERFGLVPETTCGHSFGELVALHAAGWITQQDLWKLAADRGRLMSEAGRASGESGAMLAVKAPIEALEQVLQSMDLHGKIVLANRNSPNQGVLSGTKTSIDTADRICRDKGWTTVRLPVPAAFHSHLVAGAQTPFEALVQTIAFTPGAISVMSNTTGKGYPTDVAAVKACLGRQLACPVDFLSNIQMLYKQGIRTFVEVGPKTVLTDLVKSILPEKDAQAIALDHSKGHQPGVLDLACTLAGLAALGFDVRLDRWEKPWSRSRKARMAISLSGANYRNPQAARTEPATARRTEPLKKPSPANGPAHPQKGSQTTANPIHKPVFMDPLSKAGAKQKMDDNTKTTLQNTLATVQQGLAALQALQQQTAQAHEKFLDTQAAASRTLQLMIESTRNSTTTTGYPGSETAPQPPEKQASRNAAPRPEAPQWNTAIAPPCPTDAPVEEIRPPKAAVPVESQHDRTDIEKCLLAVVSQLTGYPAEMLGLDMDIESDLGIDSIKRVEILSALEEKMPHLPQVTPDMVGTLKTLGQICDYLGSQDDLTEAAAPMGDRQPAAESPPSDQGRIQPQLIEIVSRLTGYPKEMLGLDMDIESDLGIDSIKRVEILSALEEKMPDLPKVTPDLMGSLKTLGQICDFLSEGADRAGSTASAETCGEPQMISADPKNDQVPSTLLAIVSQLTGYPLEMLGLDMDIESDLGIDSIKRVEILSALEVEMPELPKVTPDLMGSLKTLGQIVDYLSTPGQDVSASCAPPEAASAKSGPRHIERQIIQVHPLPVTIAPSVPLAANHFIGVAGALGDLGPELVNTLNRLGSSARLLTEPDELKADTPLTGLILLAPVDAFQAFRWAQVSAPLLKTAAAKTNAWFITVSALDGAFGFAGGLIDDPSQGALAGLVKTASIEWPEVRCLALDIDPAWKDFATIAESVVSEIKLSHEHRETEIGLSSQQRATLRLSPTSFAQNNTEIKLTGGDVVVVTGGARGVTAEAAKALAKETGCSLVLMGRTPHPEVEPDWLRGQSGEGRIKKAILTHQFTGQSPTPKEIEKAYRFWTANRQVRDTLDALKKLGVAAHYYPVDVNDAGAVRDAIDHISRQIGPIKALIHGAGVLEDRLIVDKQLNQFSKVYNTKVTGLLNLLDALGDASLNYLVLFSSASARFGNQGQVDYAMANEVLNKIAHRQARLRPQCKVVAINWGPWDGGMVTPALKRNFLKNRVSLIPPAEGASALLAELADHNGRQIEVVIGGPLKGPALLDPSEQPAGKDDCQRDGMFLTCKREIDVAQHPVLQSHLLDGRPVVPLALITEWLAHSALHANPGLTLHGMDNLRLFNGITLENQKRIIRMLAAKANRNGRMYEVEVEIQDDDRDDACLVHCRAMAILTDRLPAPPHFEENGHFKSSGRTPSIGDIYNRVLFHGQDLHGIQEIIRICADGISARLASAPAPIKWMNDPLRSRWIADPLILDSAFQMAIVWCHEQMGQVSLPSYAAQYRQYCERFPADGITAVLEIQKSNEHKMTGDFTFLDNQKQVIARLIGYEAIMAPGLFKAFKAA